LMRLMSSTADSTKEIPHVLVAGEELEDRIIDSTSSFEFVSSKDRNLVKMVA
jgi:hypothetical protein